MFGFTVYHEWCWPTYSREHIHHCLGCGKSLVVKNLQTTFHSNSDFANKFVNQMDEYGPLRGRIRFLWSEFYCVECGKWYDIGRYRAYEKSIKKGRVVGKIDATKCESDRHIGLCLIEKGTYYPDANDETEYYIED